MNLLGRITLLGSIAALLLACGSDSDDPEIPAVELQPKRAALSDLVGKLTCAQGEYFLAVDLALINRMSVAAPMTADLFTVRLQSGSSFGGDPATLDHSQGCKQGTAVASGATARCAIVFRVPKDMTTAAIVYHAPTGVPFEAPIQPLACQTCGDKCLDLASDAANCGACGRSVGLGTCVEGSPVCNADGADCAGLCVDLKKDRTHCGSCDTKASSTQLCVDGSLQACPEAQPTVCAEQCVDTKTSADHCGTCGKVCAKGTCEEGHCREDVESKNRESCSSVCGERDCEVVGATYDKTNCSPGGIVLLSLGSCSDVPVATEVSGDCDLVFNHIDCICSD